MKISQLLDNSGKLPEAVTTAANRHIDNVIFKSSSNRQDLMLKLYSIQRSCPICNKVMASTQLDRTSLVCPDHNYIRSIELIEVERKVLDFAVNALVAKQAIGINTYAINPQSGKIISLIKSISLDDVSNPCKGGRLIGAVARQILRGINTDPDQYIKLIDHKGYDKGKVFRLVEGVDIINACSLIGQVIDQLYKGVYSNNFLYLKLIRAEEVSELSFSKIKKDL